MDRSSKPKIECGNFISYLNTKSKTITHNKLAMVIKINKDSYRLAEVGSVFNIKKSNCDLLIIKKEDLTSGKAEFKNIALGILEYCLVNEKLSDELRVSCVQQVNSLYKTDQ